MKYKPDAPIRKHADNTAKIATIFKKHKEIEEEFHNLIKNFERVEIKLNNPPENFKDQIMMHKEKEELIYGALIFCPINIYVLNQLELEFNKIEAMIKNANFDRNTFFSNNSTIMGHLKYDIIETRNIIFLFKELVQLQSQLELAQSMNMSTTIVAARVTDLAKFFDTEYYKKFQEDYNVIDSLTSFTPKGP